MPISTPKSMVDVYSGDSNHFKHVLDYLFTPAIERAGYVPVPPISKGSEVIHAEIIRNIESSDCLLCDMSILNPNVFFELGIRTALNKPIAIVKDDATPNVPFDTNIINNHTYLHSLSPWLLENEIDKLSDHLKNCFSNGETENSLWKYFSLSSAAEPLDKKPSEGNKLDYLGMQIDALRREVRANSAEENITGATEHNIEDILFEKLTDIAVASGIFVVNGGWGGGKMNIRFTDQIPEDVSARMMTLSKKMGVKLIINLPYKKQS